MKLLEARPQILVDNVDIDSRYLDRTRMEPPLPVENKFYTAFIRPTFDKFVANGGRINNVDIYADEFEMIEFYGGYPPVIAW